MLQLVSMIILLVYEKNYFPVKELFIMLYFRVVITSAKSHYLNNPAKPQERGTPTRIMKRMAAHPDVAITLALLGTRLKSVGTIASAP